MGVSRLSDFIDRAKLEALADERYRNDPSSDAFDAYMQAVDDVIALLDAETTEERSSRIERLPGGGAGSVWYSRCVTPWLPSEGGEKP